MTSGAFRWLGRRVRDENGQALILALVIVIVGMLLALAAVAFALNAGKLGSEDEHARGAQQAADSAVQVALDQEAGDSALSYSVTAAGSLGNLLDCVVPEFNAGVEVGTVSVAAGNGGCPSAVNTNGTPIANQWQPLSNDNYDESAEFPNAVPQSGTLGPSSFSIQFPEIVGLGCNTTSSSGATDCASNASGNAKYSRELAIQDPTGPLQAIEAGNNVYLSGASLTPAQCLVLTLSSLNLSCSPTMILNGTIAAGNDVQLPSILLGVNANTSLASLVTNLLSLNLDNGITGVLGTIDYGSSYKETSVTPNASGNSGGSYTTTGTPVATFANIVPATGGTCAAGHPLPDCVLQRPSFTLAGGQSSLTGTANLSGTGYSSPTTGATAGDLTMSSGSLTLGAGTDVFCNVNITGGTVTGPLNGVAQIFVLQPGAPGCPAGQGNFTVTPGISSPSGLQAIVNGVTSAVNPSSVQIYVAGSSSNLQVGRANLPTTSVTIGGASTSLTQAMVIYAPASNVSIQTALAFVGSAVGWNVTVQAISVVQDLDLGTYPLASVVNGVKVNQYVECGNSGTQLAAPTSLAAEATDTAGCV